MATLKCSETDWQISKSSLKERNKHMFNNSLISDITFSVNNSSAHQQQSVLLIPAHKYVLAISSPVFFAMFYGHMADAARTVELADCDSDSFLELLRFVYCEEVRLTDGNIIGVLHLAKKYMLPGLAEECTKFLRGELRADNVFAVLPKAQLYEEVELVEKCWEIIDEYTEETLTSGGFLNISRDLLRAAIGRHSLAASEVEIFRAVNRWVKHQCERMQLERTGEEKRKVLGDAIHLIRFPLMTEREFATTVPQTGLLSRETMCGVFLYYNNIPNEICQFSDEPRTTRTIQRVNRFDSVHAPYKNWRYGEGTDSIVFTVNRDVSVHGVRLFGSVGARYSLTLGIYAPPRGEKLAQVAGKFDTDLEITDGYYGYDVTFKTSLAVEENTLHEIRAVINGPMSYYGEKGRAQVSHGKTCFTFSSTKTSDNGTDGDRGQFAEILFT